MASDEHQQGPPPPPPPPPPLPLPPPSEDNPGGIALLDHFVSLVGFANDRRPRIEGILAMFSDVRFWEERIRVQNAEGGDPPEPPDEELLLRFPLLDYRVSEAIGMLPRLAEMRSRRPDICGDPTHAEVGGHSKRSLDR